MLFFWYGILLEIILLLCYSFVVILIAGIIFVIQPTSFIPISIVSVRVTSVNRDRVNVFFHVEAGLAVCPL